MFGDKLLGSILKRHEIQDLLTLQDGKGSDLIYFAAQT